MNTALAKVHAVFGAAEPQRGYPWDYATRAIEDMKAVVYNFCESRAEEQARNFLGEWRGSLVCDDFSFYKACFSQGIKEAECQAYARRKFFDLHRSKPKPTRTVRAGENWQGVRDRAPDQRAE